MRSTGRGCGDGAYAARAGLGQPRFTIGYAARR